ncbi:delta-lactam-biosynthetic de-N-acetylase [Paenibacillus thalictri]|uniref:Delta-lactam-biosynthetic de-N-acetylase n=1 Tax=Paenibacillus thalictri TaxID=2527873 RepID=A0A4Q9DKR7_9BACL|nr:delta-lactam-biosynthetic de-N-acetylase [Paenibacillus thalictri]TBL75383.1 delta-lactam-biosynthetic de-N-acetylase [Paenibacillus thalictri]
MRRFAITAALTAAVMLLPAQYAPAHADTPYNYGFKKSKNGQLPSIDQEGFKEIMKKNEAIFLGDTAKKELYLTFDNGYENGFTAKILDILKEKQVPAIFFVTGQYIKDKPDLMQRMVNEGHLIGNHSWSHPDMSQVTNGRLKEELDKVKSEVTRITGQQEMHYLRPPRGVFSNRVLAESRKLGYTSVFWSIAYRDWETNKQKGADYAYQQVMGQMHPGAVILLHSVSQDNAEALPRMIDEARKQGYEFKSLDQMTVKTY